MFDEMPSNVVPNDDEDKSESFIHAIQAIAVPKYNLSNKAIEPPLVAVRLGREVFIKGIVSGAVQVTYKKPILSNEKYAIVGISFTVSEVDPYDASTVFKNGSFRGLTATLRKGMNF
jgi:CRISPR/Cas system endoribonuclease Cas6 (RAMP superfamily)